ncbi:hypothetical protein ABBQ32_005177 [Trebouxia sp. C0010 RCD-2024]
MATGWLRGTVKEVVSGDTVVIMGPSRGGPPPEKRLTLASLMAPKMARRDGTTVDEPFAWHSREFLRKKCVGQACTFKVDYVLENIPGREFGSVFLSGTNENLALLVVSSGWSKIRSAGGQQSPYYAELQAAQTKAEDAGLGLWSKDEAAIRSSVRTVNIISEDGLDAQSVLQKFGKGKPIPAVIEAVSSGSTLKATLLPDQYYVEVHLVAVSCPSMNNRRPPGAGMMSGAPAVNGNAPAAAAEAADQTKPSTAGSDPPAQPEPYAREAKYLSESKVLGRDVRVMLEGVDKWGKLFGQVMYSDGEQPVSLGESQVKAGYAKLQNWGLEMMSVNAFTLREAERQAKQQRIGIWRNYVPPANAGTKLSDKFSGTVCEIVSGDCMVVRDKANGQERRVNLSSIKAPRLGRKEEKPEPWATEAKEFLRQRLIGKEVSVEMEYNRQVPFGGAVAAEAAKARNQTVEMRDMGFATVTIAEKDGCGQQRSSNVAELLLVRGLAQVVRHRTDDERSRQYESLMNAEASGMSSKKGMHNKSKDPPVHYYNDVSLPSTSANQAKQYLPFFQRGKQKGIVEFVLSGARLKLYFPQQGVCIAFSPSGVRAPQRATQGQPGRAPAIAEPYSEEAFSFTRHHCLQREVEVEIDTMDRGGNFLGSLTVPGSSRPFNLGPALLEAGLAKLHPSFDPDRVQGGAELAAAQARAQKAKLKVWENYEPADETATTSGADQGMNGHASSSSPRETVSVTVTEVASGSQFYVQMADEPRVDYIADQLKSLSVASSSAPPRLQVGGLCLAQYSLDNQWYRASVQRVISSDPVNPQYSVIFLDFGNQDRVGGKGVRAIDSALAAVPPQAHCCSLAYLKVPSLDADYGLDAAQFLSQATGGGKRMTANIERRERQQQAHGRDALGSQPLLHVVLSKEGNSAADSVNADMLRAGLARVKAGKAKQTEDPVSVFIQCEEAARKGHTGIWIHGDPGSESDEEDATPSKPAWGRR